MYARTNRAGFRKTPVTLRDNTNEGGDDVWVSDVIVPPMTIATLPSTTLTRHQRLVILLPMPVTLLSMLDIQSSTPSILSLTSLLLRTGFNRRVMQVRDRADNADQDRTDRDN